MWYNGYMSKILCGIILFIINIYIHGQEINSLVEHLLQNSESYRVYTFYESKRELSIKNQLVETIYEKPELLQNFTYSWGLKNETCYEWYLGLLNYYEHWNNNPEKQKSLIQQALSGADEFKYTKDFNISEEDFYFYMETSRSAKYLDVEFIQRDEAIECWIVYSASDKDLVLKIFKNTGVLEISEFLYNRQETLYFSEINNSAEEKVFKNGESLHISGTQYEFESREFFNSFSILIEQESENRIVIKALYSFALRSSDPNVVVFVMQLIFEQRRPSE